MTLSWINQVGSKSNDKNPSKKRRRRDKEEKHKGEGKLKTEIHVIVMHLKAKGCQQLPAATRSYKAGMEQILALGLQRQPTLHALISDFQTPERWNNKCLLF